MVFRELTIKDLNVKYSGIVLKLVLSLETVFLRSIEVGRNIANSDIDGVGNTLLHGKRIFAVN